MRKPYRINENWFRSGPKNNEEKCPNCGGVLEVTIVDKGNRTQDDNSYPILIPSGTRSTTRFSIRYQCKKCGYER